MKIYISYQQSMQYNALETHLTTNKFIRQFEHIVWTFPPE